MVADIERTGGGGGARGREEEDKSVAEKLRMSTHARKREGESERERERENIRALSHTYIRTPTCQTISHARSSSDSCAHILRCYTHARTHKHRIFLLHAHTRSLAHEVHTHNVNCANMHTRHKVIACKHV